MAIDNTPPRLKLIATIAVITVVTLISLDFVFKSYYAMMTDEAAREKVAPARDRDEQRKAEQAALTGAMLPIGQAVSLLAKGPRPESITPQPSEDIGAMTGWSKLPKPSPTPAPKDLGGAPGIDQAAHGGDAGAALAGDAGVPGHVGDGGAPVHAGPDAGKPAHPTHPTHPTAVDGGARAPQRPAGADGGARRPERPEEN